nr:hypothetical protein [Alphaproteobacteria bacterium]
MNLTRYFFSVFFSIGCIFCHVGALHATEESDGPVETYLNKAQEVNNNPAFQAAADAVLTDATGVSGLGDVRTALANTSIENATKIYNTIKSKKNETHTTDSEESVEELEEKRTKEHNMLSGLSTAATGIGAMEMAQAISEKKADEEAERDMKAYLETMRCNYQKGPEYKYSTEDILLPGGNELLAYYTEYK